MKKLAPAIAAALVAVGASASEARMMLRCLPGHEISTVTGAAPLLRDVPAIAWINANGVKTRPATKPYYVVVVSTSDRAALASLVGLPTEFRPAAVRFTAFADVAQVASRTPSISPAQECDHDAVLPDSHLARQSVVLGEEVFGRELSSSMRITY